MKFAYLLAALLLTVPAAVADGLPELGDSSQTVFSPQEERRVGEAIMAEIRRDRSLVDDAEITDYLNGLGYRLVAASPDNRLDFEFFVIQDSSLNAFALPGGFIGVHTGLIQATQSESELAGVLAHEISHVTQHHLARLIAKQQQSSLTSLAALAVAILASRSNPQVSSAAIATAQATAIQTQLDFTREHEREADRIGLQILDKAGFDARGMASFFERLQKATRLYENNAPDYLRTHPITSERIADIENRLEKIPYHQVPDSLEFQLVRAKVQATQDSPRQAVAFFEDSLREKKYSNVTAQRYGLAVALMRAKDYPQAEQELASLRKGAVPNAMVENLAAQLKAEEGQETAALAQYRAALRTFPSHRALIYGYADTLLHARQSEEALKVVTRALKSFPSDYHLHQFQAQAYAAQGKRLLSHQAQAEAYVRLGNLTAAIEQLQAGLKAGDGDFYQLSMAEARLRELRTKDAETRKR
jgi:predicted Zn-dependent protease